jgi:hypothetical protein
MHPGEGVDTSAKDRRIQRDDERTAHRQRAREAARRIDRALHERAVQSDRVFGADLERILRDRHVAKGFSPPRPTGGERSS